MKLSPARLTRKTPAGIIAFALVLSSSACIDNVKPADPLDGEQTPGIGEYIEVVPDVAALQEVGDRVKLEASVRDSRGRVIPGARVTWQTADAGVATADASGNVTGVSEGMTEISGINGNLSSVAVVAVAKKGVGWGSGGAKATVAVSPEDATVATVGGSVKLLAVGYNGGGHLVSGDKMEWGSTNTDVATVSKGVVTGKSSGEARIIVVNGSAADTASVAVAPPGTPASVLVTPDADTIPTIGGTVKLVGQVLNGSGAVLDYEVTWSSLDPSVASVWNGTVTGLAKGVARIRANWGSLADTARIWVGQTVTATSVFVLPRVDTIPQVGGTSQITATALDGNGNEIAGAIFSWGSMDPSVATVDAAGLVTGVSKGTARIIARLGTLVDTATITVAPASPTGQAARISIAPQTDTIPTLGSSVVLTATVTDSTGNTLNVTPTWRSLDPWAASVGLNGEVKGLANGVARITASIGNVADTAIVVVAAGNTGASIRIVPDTATIPTVGGVAYFMAVMTDAQGNTVNTKPTWATLDPSLVTVNGEGDVKALAKGTARITATWSGISDTARVFVAPSTTSSPTISLSHSPSSPSTTSTVTIAAAVSASTAYTSSSISVDGQVVKTCSSGSCSYSAILPAGSHNYSATATDNSGNTLSAGPNTLIVWQTTPGTTTPGSPTSPHWPHARFAAFDYRIHYLSEPQRSFEYDQVAKRYDVVVGGDVDEWKSRNPAVKQFVYDLIVGERQQDVAAMESWLTAHGYPVENAYVHNAGTSKTKANRVSYYQWTDNYWLLNPADPGQIAWRQQVTQQLTAVRSSGFRFDGLFFDVLGGGLSGPQGHPNGPTLEYASKAAYLGDLHTMLGRHRAWTPSGMVMANTGNYTTSEEVAQTDASGAALMEFSNDIYNEGAYRMWGYVRARIAAGTPIVLVPQRTGALKNTPRYNMNAGNYGTVAERVLLAEYANYLMLVDPARMDLLSVDFYLTGSVDPSQPHSITWLKAYEADLGLAVGAPGVLKSGTDGGGQRYDAYAREFEHAVVVYRPVENWSSTNFGDATAVSVPLPAGPSWMMLRPDGSRVGPVTNVQLRNGEAAIFMK